MTYALRKHCQTRKATLDQERDLHVRDWQQVADYIDPVSGRYLSKKSATAQALPSRAKVINSEATRACRTMDAGFMGGHTSKSRPWFVVKPADPRVRELPDVKAWADDLTNQIRDVLSESNFYTELPRAYHSRHLFSICALAMDEDELDVVRFYSRNIGTYSLGLDHRGICDSIAWAFPMTVRQVVQWSLAQLVQQGRAADTKAAESLLSTVLPASVIEKYRAGGGKGDERVTVCTLIEPNPDKRDGLQGPLYRPFRQLCWIEGTTQDGEHGCLAQMGHYEFPVVAPSWDSNGPDPYGSSPALDALGDIKQLQYLEGEKLRIIDQMSKPALAMPDYLRNKGAGINPGERVYLTPMQTAQKVEPIYTPDPAGLAAVQQEIARVEERIRSAFFADLFRMLDFLDDRQRTAFEISERKEEKVAMLGPNMETLDDKGLSLVLSRVYAVLVRRGRVADPPPALDGMPMLVEYTSALALAMKAAGLATIERVIGFAGQVFQASQRPEVWDKIDLDQALDEFHERAGAPARIVRSDDEVAQIRQARMAEQQQAKLAAMAKPIADAANATRTLAETVPQDGSALEALNAANGA